PKVDNLLEPHELAQLFPSMSDEQFEELVEDVRQHGLRQPIVLYEKKILDGVNRHQACIEADVRPKFQQYNGSDPLSYVISANLRRRNLDATDRALIAGKIANIEHGRGGKFKGSGEPLSLKEAAKQLDTSKASAVRARKILNRGVPQLQKAVEKKEI